VADEGFAFLGITVDAKHEVRDEAANNENALLWLVLHGLFALLGYLNS
jgi:hypothetical protein